MTNWQKFGLGFLIVATLAYVKISFFPSSPNDTELTKEDTKEEELLKEPEIKKVKQYANIFFLGQNEKGEEIYRAVKREYVKSVDGSKINFALNGLLKGPSMKEKNSGIYSEIPSTTRVISITETPTKVTINLTGDFENGGGTDSLYKRLYQIIKTANKNTDLPVYLFIDGKQADVIGGEGIMITQPLSEGSIDG